MRTQKLCIAIVLAGAVACSGSRDGMTGTRFDGVKVECTKQSDDVTMCTPVAADQCDSAAGVLWPPNHKMIGFTLDDCIAISTGCGSGGSGGGEGNGLMVAAAPAPAGAHVTSITSDEAVEVGAGGDGHTPVTDIAITDATTFSLRSERQGGGDGRVYHVNYVDAAGVAGACEYQVPHDQGPAQGAVDSGVVVTVTP